MDAKVRMRGNDFVADYVKLGALAAADGIYEEYTARKTGLIPYGKTDKESFFVISHMHIDHMGGLGCLHPDIPVYMSADSYKLYRRIAANGEVEHREHHNCIGVEYGGEFTVGDIRVKVVAVDHDVVGACGFLITTPDGTVCYTGDYRFHGFHLERSEAFGKTCAGVDVLITEGVTASFEDVDMLSLSGPKEGGRTEEDLQKELALLSREEKGLLVVNPYNRNVERLHRMVGTFKENGRTLILDAISADYVSAFYSQDEIVIYKETYDAVKGMGKTAAARNLPTSWKLVSRKEIVASPSKYAMLLDYADLYELLDLKEAAPRYVHMDGAPLGEYDPSYAKLKAFLETHDIFYDYKGLGGHAEPYYLRKMIDDIAPKILIPLHSFRPEQIGSAMAGQRILPSYGDSYALENGTMRKL